MIKNQIVRVKPQLVRKRSQVILPKNVSVIIKPSRTQVISLKDLKDKKPRPTPAPSPKPQQQPAAPRPSAVSANARQQLIKQRRTRKKSTEVKYITRDIAPESAHKIASLKNSGKGKILIIIGNGPSILEADLSLLSGIQEIDILSVNKPDSRVWPTKYWAFFDTSQFRRNEDLWNAYNGIIFNSTAIKKQKQTSMQLKNQGHKGWSRDLLRGIHIGRSSVFASLQIAHWLNHEHVYIFGCDMDPEGLDGKLHFYGNNPDVKPEDRKTRFKKEAVHYDHAATIMTADERSKFTFCSSYNKWPFVDQFNKMDHKTAVENILKHAEQLHK